MEESFEVRAEENKVLPEKNKKRRLKNAAQIEALEQIYNESPEVRSEENKVPPETNKKRRLKTAAQIEALEQFYNEHKYPTEPMKLQLAESLALTEKQVSGWFCHRRLKDKRLLNCEANGRPDHSSGIVQDRGSGQRQDSCGSTKQGDCRHIDPLQIESGRLSGQDVSAADIRNEHGSHFTGCHSGTEDTSSGSSSPLYNKFYSQSEVPVSMPPSSVKEYKDILIDVVNVQKRNGPSGYLKLKGQVENVAITAVKRQLGRQYREDGPQLAVEFQPPPPGAFESSTRDQVNELNYVGDSILPPSPKVTRTRKQPNYGARYELPNSNMSTYPSGLDGMSFRSMHGPDRHENYRHNYIEKNSPLPNYSNSFPRRNLSSDFNENSTGETSVYGNSRNYRMGAKHRPEEMRVDSDSSHHLRPYGGKHGCDLVEPWFHNYEDDMNHKVVQKNHFKSKSANLKQKRGESLELEGSSLRKGMAKEDKFYGERRIAEEYSEPVSLKAQPTDKKAVAKRVWDTCLQQQFPRNPTMEETPPLGNHFKRPAVEMPSSFSEDETAETSSSVD